MLLVLWNWFIICSVTYLFLSLCNWDLNLKDWTGFSRFLLAGEGLLFLIGLFEA
jgi:hypothetical protein